MSKRTTFMLILDACRRDYLTPDKMPFLAGFAETGLQGNFESPPGFAQRTTMFTGTYPDTSQNFSAFGYGPENSPFQWVEKLGPLRHLHRPRKIMFPARVGIKYASKWITGQYHTDPAWIPATFLPYFEVVEDSKPIFEENALPHRSVFDLCREHGKKFFYGAHPVSGDDEEIFEMLLERFRRGDDTDLYVAQFSALDENGHHDGPVLPDGWEPPMGQTDGERRNMREQLLEIDRKCRVLVETLQEKYDEVNVLILGDHGMAPVRRRVNILDELKSTGLKPGDDYVVFVDSTFAKVWFQNDHAERLIRDKLGGADYGHVLTDEERREHRIDFDHRRYGDLMFTADAGVLFWPDYFHVVEHDIKGMHGYIDKSEETYGAMALHGPGVEPKDVGKRILVDVFPTLCELVGIPVPEHNEGTSLLREPAGAPKEAAPPSA